MPRGGPRPGAGRPAGSPNADTAARRAALADLMADHVDTAIAALAHIAANGQSETARISAACAILDRTHGRPAQAVELDNGPQVEMPTTIIIRGVSPDDPDD
jgi:hypothetical protein